MKSSEKETSLQPESASSDAHAGMQSDDDAKEGEAVVSKAKNDDQQEANDTSTALAKDIKRTSTATLVANDSNAHETSETPEVPENLADAPQHRRLTWPTREQWIQWAPLIGIVLLGAILRFWGLGDKPLHHDESLHAYFSLNLLHTTIYHWASCAQGSSAYACYAYDPLLHGPFQFHMIALVYQISQWLGAPDNGVNTTTVRIGAATLGTVIVALPYLLRGYLGRLTALLACFLLAISPSMLYFSRFAREDIYMACFTLVMVVGIGCYIQSRRGFWLVIAAVGFALSYATKEATFLSIAIFGSFLVMLIVWEACVRFQLRSRVSSQRRITAYLPKTVAPVALLGLVLVLAPLALVFLHWMDTLSVYENTHTVASDAYVKQLEDATANLFPWLGIVFGFFVLGILIFELLEKEPKTGRRGLARFVNPQKQPLLDTIVTMPWTHWVFAILANLIVFLVLFTALFTNVKGGIGTGIWQGLYYWIQQQHLGRGGQPWYYYFLLIPLYEQIGLVFGVVGIVRCLRRPSVFRLFLVYWFLGNVFIYSWAGEKMPWLTIHMTMVMMLLAALGLEPLVVRLASLVKSWVVRRPALAAPATEPDVVTARSGSSAWANAGVILSGVLALGLLVLTLQNMFQLTYVHYADAPHEMMIYVQTTTDVNIVMSKVDNLDQQKFGGKHTMPIAVLGGADWPFYWYLRDYTNVCYGYPTGCATLNPAVILGADTDLATAPQQYASRINGKPAPYLYHQYHLRTWWDEGYKPAPCVVTKTNNCVGHENDTGVGLFTWLSYGDTPPTPGAVDLGRAAGNVWNWWWTRQAIGSTGGTTDMGLFIRNDLGAQP